MIKTSDVSQSKSVAQKIETTQLPQTQTQTQYFERKQYELQPQPPQPPAPQHYLPQTSSNSPPVVVHDHKHKQEVFNANIGVHTPSAPVSSMSSSLANISLGEGGDQYPIEASNNLIHSTITTSSTGYPTSAVLPVSQIGSESFGIQTTNPYTSYSQPNYSNDMSRGINSFPTYATQSFTTPVCLPGMPPITVSATLPTDKFTHSFPNPYTSQTFNSNIPTNQSVGYQIDPNQSYSPQI